jgi:hypothetical protein
MKGEGGIRGSFRRQIMKRDQVQLGKVYAVKVSGTVQPVRIQRERDSRLKAAYGSGRVTERHGGWDGVNLKTGRTIRISSAAKLRFELVLNPNGRYERAVQSGEVVLSGPSDYSASVAHCKVLPVVDPQAVGGENLRVY